nr:ribonuclease H-like domain-containing protein [Tanacetum cinerariifolium]
MSTIIDVRCVLSQKAFDALCEKFHIPKEVHHVLPDRGNTMHERHAGKIGLYIRFFNFANFRLPLSTFLVDILSVLIDIPYAIRNLLTLSKIRMITFFYVDDFACPVRFPWHTAKNMTRDPTPVAADFNVQDYATLVAHPSPFQKFPKEFLCLLDLAAITLWMRKLIHMDIFVFIHTTYPTKVKVVERERKEDEPRLLETIVGCIVPLLLVAPDRGESELNVSVDKLFDEGDSGAQTEQGDSVSGEGEQGMNIHPVIETGRKLLNLFVCPDFASTGGTDPAMASLTDLTSSDFLVGGIRTVINHDSDLQKTYVPQWNVTNGSRLDDGGVFREMVDEFAPPKFFTSVRRMEHDQLFTEFNVRAAHQMSLSAEVRMRAEYNIREKMRLKSVVEEKDQLLKDRDEEVKNHKVQLLLKEAEAEEAIRLCADTFKLKTVEKPFGMRKRIRLKQDKSEQNRTKTGSVVHELQVSSFELIGKLSNYKNLMERLEKFQDVQLKVINDKFDKLYTYFFEMSLQLKERFYPHLLTTIAGRSWLLTYGMKLAVVKYLNSPEYLLALGTAISKAIKKADYVSALQQLQGVNFSLLVELKANKDASIEAVMNILRLEEHLDVLIPLAEPFSAAAVTGTECTFDTVPSTIDTTIALSVTFASASIVEPRSIDDYELRHQQMMMVPQPITIEEKGKKKNDVKAINLDTMSLDDLYNNFKVVEQEIRRTSRSHSSNMAFVSSPSHNSTNEVPTVFGVSTASPHVSTANLSDATVYAFLANQLNGSQLMHEDLEQIHEDDLEEMDLKVPRNQENRTRNQETTRRTINVEDTSSKAMVAIDGAGFDWSYMDDDEAPTNMAFMALSYSELIGSQVTDNSKKGLGYVSYNAVPPPHTGSYRVKPIEVVTQKSSVKTSAPVKENNGAPLIEDWESNEEDKARCKYHPRGRMINGTNHSRVNHNTNTVPKVMLTKTSLKPVNSVRHVNPKRNFQRIVGYNNINFFKKVNNAKEKVNTARPNSAVLNAIRANKGKVIKASIKDQGYFDSGCSRHMIGNISYLTDFKEFDGGYVAFRGGAKGGKITNKGIIRTGKIDFEDVYFFKELQFKLFSVSQMCDKKNNVLFTDAECFVLSHDYKLVDESHVLLIVPIKNNTYSVDTKNIVSKKDLTCLVVKVTNDESMLWHGKLSSKDETSRIFKSFITEIENLVDKKVKIIRCDNGTEFKNRVMNEFCEEKDIKKEYSEARTPQQNRVAERRNRTLIETARTIFVMPLFEVRNDCWYQGRRGDYPRSGALDIELYVRGPHGYWASLRIEPDLISRIKEAQKEDSEIWTIVENLDKQVKFRIDEANVLWQDTRLVVPNDASLREALLTEAHSSPFSVHPGSTKIHDLKQHFWWSGIK